MPARVVRGEINASRSLARVSMEADLTFRALVVAVDDYGRFEADPLMLKAALFPRRPRVLPEEVADWVAELAREGCVQLYAVDGVAYLQLTGWERHRGNSRRSGESKYPRPPEPDRQGAPADAESSIEALPGNPGDSRKSGTVPEIREIPGNPSESRESGVGSRESRVESGPGNPGPSRKRAAARSPAPPAEWALGASESLRRSVQRRWPGAPVPASLVSWARDFARIRAPEPEVLGALAWYVDPSRDGDRYLPECRSGRSFREKYDAILAARKRASLPTRPAAPQRPEPAGKAYRPFVPERREAVPVVSVLSDLRKAMTP